MGLFHPPRTSKEAHEPPPRRSLVKRLPWELRLLVIATVYLGLPAMAGLAGLLVYYSAVLPDPLAMRHEPQGPIVSVLARDGSPLNERGASNAYIPVDLLPRHLVDAVLAAEDRRFFQHWGFDPAGLARAALANLRAGHFSQGGSTLTQQLAKNLFLSPERTIARKVEELTLALWLELRLSKRDILEAYLNRVYFGGGAYGVEAAAQRFFGKSARNVNVAEAAMLAGLLKAPSRYSPAWNPAIAKARSRNVLGMMVEAGFLAPKEAEEAASTAIGLVDQAPRRDSSGADYVVDAVIEQLPTLVGPTTGKLIVETTIDGSLQRRTQALVTGVMENEGQKLGAGQAGLILLDMEGGIRAMVGGRSYAESQFNRALKARRQPGSAFKTFVYLAALEAGMTPDSKVLDLPILGSGWSPRNEGEGYRGEVTLREALSQSMNAAAARLNMSVGPRKTVAVARRLGIGSALRAQASLALGTSEVTLARADRRLRRARQRGPHAGAAPDQPSAHAFRPAALPAAESPHGGPGGAASTSTRSTTCWARCSPRAPAAAPRLPIVPRPARPARRKGSGMPGSSATRPTSRRACGSATTTSVPCTRSRAAACPPRSGTTSW